MGPASGYGIGPLRTAAEPRYAALDVPSPRTWSLTLAYDGTDFAGWQTQPGRTTVQGRLEAALSQVEGAAVRAAGSGRTDAGVHALGQVASCSMANPLPAQGLLKALNRLLPAAIRVTRARVAPPGFHARRSAVAKTYEYRIQRAPVCSPFDARYVCWHPYPLDEGAMQLACARFVGERDFQSFASAGGSEPESTVRTVHSSALSRDGDLLTYRVRGTGFLYRMVRNFVGTLLEVGRGNLGPDDIEAILATRDRAAAGPTAAASGLFLASVEYPATLAWPAGPGVSSS